MSLTAEAVQTEQHHNSQESSSKLRCTREVILQTSFIHPSDCHKAEVTPSLAGSGSSPAAVPHPLSPPAGVSRSMCHCPAGTGMWQLRSGRTRSFPPAGLQHLKPCPALPAPLEPGCRSPAAHLRSRHAGIIITAHPPSSRAGCRVCAGYHRTAPVMPQPISDAQRQNPKTAAKTTNHSTVTPLRAESALISNLGHFPQPWNTADSF